MNSIAHKLNRQVVVSTQDGETEYLWHADRKDRHQNAVRVYADYQLSNEQIAAELRKIADLFEQHADGIQEARRGELSLEFREFFGCFNTTCCVCGESWETGQGVDVIEAETRQVVCDDCANELLTPDRLAELAKKRQEANKRFAEQAEDLLSNPPMSSIQSATNLPDDIPF